MIDEQDDRVEVHRILEIQTQITGSVLPTPLIQQAAGLRPFTLKQHWMRGGFIPSLYASSSIESYEWRGEYIRRKLPNVLGFDIDDAVSNNRIWSVLAKQNGWHEEGVRRKLQIGSDAFKQMMENFHQHGAIFRLPLWSPPGETSDNCGLFYFTDTGIHLRILNLRTEGDMREPILGKSWEGFVIRGLCCAAGLRAVSSVWQDDDGEIDLILDWEDGSTWAIEITRGLRKSLKDGFHRGRKITGASRAIVIQGDSGSSPHDKDIEYMTFEEALRAVTAGP